MKMTRSWILAALLAAAIGAGAVAEQTTQTESLNIQLDGRKTWTVRYGFGDPAALSASSLAAGQLTLDQTLWVDFAATALSVFRVEGHFDDQEPEEMQSLSLYLDTENVDGVLGDFTAPSFGSFYSGSRSMTGTRVDVTWDGGTAAAVLSQPSGTSETRAFIGDTASGERTFAGEPGDEGVSYATSLEGYGYIELRDLYVQGFTEVRLGLGSPAVSGVLAQYGVSELAPCLQAYGGRTVSDHEAVVVSDAIAGDGTQLLVLRMNPRNLVRETIEEAIRSANATDSEAPLTYPLVVGSEAEGEFLASLVPLATLAVGEETRTLGELRWRRLYDLGQEDVAPESVVTAVRLRGEYVATSDPRISGYLVRVHAAEGLLEVSFPDSFYLDSEPALRAAFAYRVAGGTYFLGAAVIPGSDRVTLAGRVLVRDTDYTIDYEYGVLSLIVGIGPSDPLSVEFERYGGGGSSGAYARTFYGATATVPVGEEWSLTGYALRAADDRGSVDNPDSVRVMPNTQTVLGVSGSLARPDLSTDFDVGYTDDIFPYDDNARIRTPNRVRAIAAVGEWVFVGTDAGFSALHGGLWRAYDSGSGLSGREVRAIAANEDAVYLGTESGLTVVRLIGVAPLDKAANWSSYGTRDGLLDDSVHALALSDGVLWIGTDAGLTKVGVGELDDPAAWTSTEHAALVDVQALAIVDGIVYAGTTDGLVRLDPDTGEVVAIGTPGAAVACLAVDNATIYAAGEDGVRSVVDGSETGWVVSGRSIEAVATVRGAVLCGTKDGLWSPATDETAYAGWDITALFASGDTLWAGSEGNGAGELLVWWQGAGEVAYGVATTKINPWNPRVYVDASAADHTTSGWLAQGSFAYQGDGYSVTGELNRVFPGFRPIDGRGRASVGGWSVTSDIDLGTQASLSFDHHVDMSDLGLDEAGTTVEQGLAFRGSFGPEVTLGLRHRVQDTLSSEPGYEQTVVSYDVGVRQSMFEDALRVSLSWDEDLHWEEGVALRRETNLSATATLEIAPALTASLSWRRPVRILGDTVSGSEQLALTSAAGFDIEWLGVAASYDLGTTRSLPDGATAWTHRAKVDLTVQMFELGGASFAPTLSAAAHYGEGATLLSGQLGLRFNVSELSTRSSASVDVDGIGTRVLRWTERLSSSASYAGIPGLRPTLSYNGVRAVTQVAGQGTKATMSHSVTGRVTWSGRSGASETLSVAARIQTSGTSSATLDNTFVYDITDVVGPWIARLRAPAPAQTDSSGLPAAASAAPAADTAPVQPTVMLRTDAGVDWRRQSERDEASWRVGASADVALSSTWTLSLGLTYRGGVRTATDPFHGLVIEMTVAIDFKR